LLSNIRSQRFKENEMSTRFQLWASGTALFAIGVLLVIAGLSHSPRSNQGGAGNTNSSLNAKPLGKTELANQKKAYERASKRGAARAVKHDRAISAPAAQARRQASKHRFRHLGKKAARQAIVSQQDQFASNTLWQPPTLQAGEKITAYTSEDTARIDMPGTKIDAFVQSTGGPIAIKGDSGHFGPVDLGLKADSDGSFEPRNTKVPTSLPGKFSDGIKLGPQNSAGQIVISSGSSTATPTLLPGGDKLFYANTDVDTDAIAEAIPQGAALSWQLRSPLAPETFSLDMKFSAGVTYSPQPNGSVDVKFGDYTVATVQPVSAFDAQGTQVPAKYVVSKTGIKVQVPHRAGDYAYPIIVDPQTYGYGFPAFMDSFGVSPVTNTSSIYGWSWNQPTAYMTYNNDPGGSPWRMYIKQTPAIPSAGFYWGYLQYAPPNASTIFRVTMSSVLQTYTPQSGKVAPAVDVQINNSSGGLEQDWGTTGAAGPGDVTICVNGDCSLGGSVANRARFIESQNIGSGQSTNGSAVTSTLGGYIYFSDYAGPVISAVPTNQNWTNTISTFNPVLDDPGVGLGYAGGGPETSPMIVTRDGSTIYNSYGAMACNGGFSNPCQTHVISGTITAAPGRHDYSFTSSDISGRPTSLARTFRIDTQAPDIDLSGRLGAFALDTASVTGTNDPRTLVANAPFVITAHDGDPATRDSQRSGVQSITAKLYGSNQTTGAEDTSVVVQDFDASNSPAGPKQSPSSCAVSVSYPDANSCKLSYAGTFNASTLSPGVYYFHVTATDYVGQSSTKIFKVGVGVASVNSVYEGQETARFVPISVTRVRGSATAMRLQYRLANDAPWCSVPVASIKKLTDQSSISGTDPNWWLTLSGASSPDLVVDLDMLRTTDASCAYSSTAIPDGNVRIRALLNGSGASFLNASEDVTVRYDRGGKTTNDAGQKLGPGSVDLVTGNFSMSASDVSIDAYQSDLTFTRTYNSRYSDKSSILGPGWEIGLPVDSAASEYTAAIDNADVNLSDDQRYPSVDIKTTDGSFITFELSDSTYSAASPIYTADKYLAPPGLESLELRRIPDPNDPIRTSGFALIDGDSSTVVSFQKADTQSPPGAWLTSNIAQTGLKDQINYSYTPNSETGKSTISSMTAPTGYDAAAGTGVNCGTVFASIPRGCQALRFNYITVGSTNQYFRLGSITLRTWDPQLAGGAGMRQIDVASYSYDSSGRLTAESDPRIAPALSTGYTYTTSGASQLLTTATPPGELPFTINYTSSIPQDTTPGRVDTISRSALAAGTAISSVRYYVPTNPQVNPAAPYDFSATKVAQWGQPQPPWMATAVFSPDQPPNGTPATNYTSSSMSYLDPIGRVVNSATPGGRINVTQYDSRGNIVRTLSAENRQRAVNDTGNTLSDAQKWDTQNTYDPVPGSPDGRLHLTKSIGPEHQVRLDDDSWVTGRTNVRYTYDEGSPYGDQGSAGQDTTKEPFDLVTTKRESMLVSGTDYDTRTTTTSYGTTEASWKLHTPLTTVTDPGAGHLAITRTVNLNVDGQETERFQPRSQASSEPSTTRTVYYSELTNSEFPACGGKPEWKGLPCKVGPGAQPTTSGMPKLPTQLTNPVSGTDPNVMTYNYLRQPVSSTQSVVDAAGNTQTRTTAKTYDMAGRVLTESLTGTVGVAVNTTEHVYSATTGRETTTNSKNSGGTVVKTISRTYDSLGRQTNYTDGEGHASTVSSYDVLSRPLVSNDGKATRTNTYDSITGDLTQVVDSGVGTFQGSYDSDGALISESLPGGIVKAVQTDATGSPTYMSYNRTTGCSSSCLLYDNYAIDNAHGQMSAIWNGMAGQDTTSQFFDYDAAGRLKRTQDYTDVSAGTDKCEVRDYGFDADSNRATKRTRPDIGTGDCDWGGSGTLKTNTYDAADRLTNSGYVYDAFGRTTTVPQADAGGSSNMTATFYVNDLAQSITDSGTTQTLNLDPNMRMSTKVKTGGTSSTESYAYADDSDSPAWTQTGTAWSRNACGLGGDEEAIQDSAAGVKLLIENMRGDVVAQSTTSGTLSNISIVDEFGVPKAALTAGTKYAFKGSKKRETLTSGGTIAMGVRLYVPRNGQFLQPDPIVGGNASPYIYPADPVNQKDLTGESCYEVSSRSRHNGIGAKVSGHWCSNDGKQIDSSNSYASADCDIDLAGKVSGTTTCKGQEHTKQTIQGGGKRMVLQTTVKIGNGCWGTVFCNATYKIKIKATFRADGTYRIHYLNTLYPKGDKRRNVFRNGKGKQVS
jgi:RHS repeat-associated protein